MSPRTIFLGRLIGLYCVLCALCLTTHKEAAVEAVTALLHDSPILLLLGVITLFAGLAMVLAHNKWSGGALAVIVTVIGWLTLIKGLLFMFLPSDVAAQIYLKDLHYDQLFYLYMAVVFIIGACLTYGGFSSKSPS